MTSDDYVHTSKRIWAKAVGAQDEKDQDLRYTTVFEAAGEWVELAYTWVETNGCRSDSVRRVFFDLLVWYLPSLHGDLFRFYVMHTFTSVNYSEHAASFRPGHAAMLRHMPYELYLQTYHWQRLRDVARDRAQNRCQVCNATGLLDVHHRTYARRGAELPEDLIVLCRTCHRIFHEHQKLAAYREVIE